ncbi:MAG: 3-phosphoglycerate dehydrogenase [Bacteroidales bacterium]|nr:3-phosphoglycerate dehydrogenase [Bacteroidales bacterium]MBN2697235.1 3-phosphoglycerate dehydrogenase [Bacteroidales bacterium]
MTKVLIATEKPFSGKAVSEIRGLLTEAGYEVVLLEKYGSQDALLKAVEEVDAMIIRSDVVDKDVINASRNLKIVVRAGAGYDNVDLEAAKAKGVVVMNTPGQNANAVAELAFGMMVYLNRNKFNPTTGTELRGKTLGIHAYGYVGRIVGMIGKGFGMKVYAFDPYIDKVIIENDGVVSLSSAEDLYRTCQYVSLHIPANKETRESINYDLMNLMPQGATLVNTARKEVIDEASLLKIFNMRSDFRYLSDIAPDCAAEIEQHFEGRFFFTPKKMGAQTAEANLNAGVAAARQIVNFLDRGDETFRVN